MPFTERGCSPQLGSCSASTANPSLAHPSRKRLGPAPAPVRCAGEHVRPQPSAQLVVPVKEFGLPAVREPDFEAAALRNGLVPDKADAWGRRQNPSTRRDLGYTGVALDDAGTLHCSAAKPARDDGDRS